MAISAVVVALNAVNRIERVVNRLKGFDEILVCDGGSTDGTPELARKLGCRVITYAADTHMYADPARNYAIRHASSEWVLMVDTDELVNPELVKYLYKFIKRPGNIKGLLIPRKNYLLHVWRKCTYPDYQLRFFSKDAMVWPSEPHSRPVVKGEVERIPAGHESMALMHMSPSISEVINRLNRYTTLELDKTDMRPVTLARMILEPGWTFFSTYVLKGSMWHGVSGMVAASNDAIYRYVRLAKRYESQEEDSWPEELRELDFNAGKRSGEIEKTDHNIEKVEEKA